MPKLLDRTPKYRQHKPSGQAVVTLNHRDFYLGPWRSKASRIEYDRLIGEWLANDRQPIQDDGSTLDVTELVAAYWQYAESYYVKDGRPTCLPGIRVALRFLRHSYGNTLAKDFGPLALKALQARMVEAGHSRRYVNGNIGSIRRCFKWAVAQEMIPVTVFQALQTVPGLKLGRTAAREPEPIMPVTDDVVEATLPFLPPVIADMVCLQQLVGCRPGEVCQLRPCDVDTSDDIWRFRPASHKTQHHNRQRVICIGPKAQEILRPYLLRDHQTFCFSPVESRRKQYAVMREKRQSKVQPSQIDRSKQHPKKAPRERYTKDSYNRAVRRACLKADEKAHKNNPQIPADQVLVPTWRPNQLRHSVATKVRQEFGIEGAQVVLGHSRADVTQVYAERDMAKAEAIMRKMG